MIYGLIRCEGKFNERYSRGSATPVNDYGIGNQAPLITRYIFGATPATINIASAFNVLSGMTGALSQINIISANINATSGMTGLVNHLNSIASALNVTSGMTGAIRHINSIASNVNVLSGMTGGVSISLTIGGIISALSGMTGSLTSFSMISGTINVISNMFEIFKYLKPIYVNSEITESVTDNSIILKGRVI